MYSESFGLTVGFHGCERKIADDVLNGKRELKPSDNDYDWLGPGIYFWERDPERAMRFATEDKKDIKEPAVIGAIIDVRNCLDLRKQSSVEIVRSAYNLILGQNGGVPPKKNTVKKGGCLIKRDLDCLVIKMIHQVYDIIEKPYDSVVGLFEEGDSVYPTSGFKDKTHTQICVRDTKCILGYFLPRKVIL